jgi:hypothetical protein
VGRPENVDGLIAGYTSLLACWEIATRAMRGIAYTPDLYVEN